MLIIQPYSLSLLIFLACLREDYAEAVRLKELGKHHGTSPVDFQLLYWALAALTCGLGRPTEVRVYIQKMLQLSDHDVNFTTLFGLFPVWHMRSQKQIVKKLLNCSPGSFLILAQP